jgi:hypothetical protein
LRQQREKDSQLYLTEGVQVEAAEGEGLPTLLNRRSLLYMAERESALELEY